MAAAAEETVPPAAAPAAHKMVGEWFWRFLALVMLISVGWVVWIIYQINPPPLITNAGFAAAAKARASAQDAKGRITPAAAPAATVAAGPAEPAKAPVVERKEPPVNVERLRFSDAIETPIPESARKK